MSTQLHNSPRHHELGSPGLEWAADGALLIELAEDGQGHVVWASQRFQETFNRPLTVGRVVDFIENSDHDGAFLDVLREVRPAQTNRWLVRVVGENNQRLSAQVVAHKDPSEARLARYYCTFILGSLGVSSPSVSQTGRYLRVEPSAAAETLARVGSWELDVGTGRWRWSHETFALFGVTPETFEPTSAAYAQFLSVTDLTQFRAQNAACIKHGGGYELHVRINRAWRSRIWVRIVARAQVTDGVVTRVVGAIQDIDDVKRAGVRMQRQSLWLSLALSANLLATWRWYPDTDALVLDALDERRFSGLKERQPLDRWLALFVEADSLRLRKALHQAASSGEALRLECELGSTDKPGWIAIRGERFISTDGVAVVGTFQDITESRADQRYLRTQAQVLADMAEGVCVTDADGLIRLSNPAFGAMWLAPLDLLGRPLVELLPMLVELQSGSSVEVQRSDGSWFSAAVSVSPLRVYEQDWRIYIVRDETQRRELQAELLASVNREQRRIGSDLHDGLGQELTGIALLLRGLESRIDRGLLLEAADVADIIQLVNQAIQSTRSMARGLSPVDIEHGGLIFALRALAERASALYGLNIKFSSKADGPLTLSAATKMHLYRIAQEALTNAARHAQAQDVVLRLSVQGEKVLLTIKDDGQGLKDSADIGMGLKIMRYRCEIIGASLAITSAKRAGTRITCALNQPLVTGDNASREFEVPLAERSAKNTPSR